MIFLITYNRMEGRLEALSTFEDSGLEAAQNARLLAELQSAQASRELEIVLLQAPDEAALRTSHRRYFEGLQSLSQPKAES